MAQKKKKKNRTVKVINKRKHVHNTILWLKTLILLIYENTIKHPKP